jgi:glutathione S-transferase
MLTLYHHGSSVCAAKVRIVLYEKDLAWDGEYVDVLKGEQFDPAYMKLNPNAVVPTLIHDGKVVIESTVICEYLDDLSADPPLRPDDAYAAAQMRIWTKRVDERLHPMTSVLTYTASHRHTILDNNSPAQVEEMINETRDPVKRARKREWIERGMDAPTAKQAVTEFKQTLTDMENTLAKQPWLAGDTYSLADVALSPYLNRLSMLSMDEFWQGYTHVADWFSRVRSRATFAPALLEWVPSDLTNSLATNGAKSWPQVAAMLKAD